jgi:hypothetical protein
MRGKRNDAEMLRDKTKSMHDTGSAFFNNSLLAKRHFTIIDLDGLVKPEW